MLDILRWTKMLQWLSNLIIDTCVGVVIVVVIIIVKFVKVVNVVFVLVIVVVVDTVNVVVVALLRPGRHFTVTLTPDP